MEYFEAICSYVSDDNIRVHRDNYSEGIWFDVLESGQTTGVVLSKHDVERLYAWLGKALGKE